MRRVSLWTFTALVALALRSMPVWPDEQVKNSGEADEAQRLIDQRVEETLRLATAEARAYDIFIGLNSKTRLELDDKSILRWSNPITGAYGEMFLWAKNSRPLVIASVYHYPPDRYMAVAFQSLAGEKLVATRGPAEVRWPSSGGVNFQPLPDAPRPATSSPKRLAQMRALARDVRVQITTQENDKEWLRLLPQPGYRYRCEGEHVLDGTIFIFTQGTTPHALLLLEARRTNDGDRWHFALARQTRYQLEAFRGRERIWKVSADSGEVRGDAFTVHFDTGE